LRPAFRFGSSVVMGALRNGDFDVVM